MFDIGMSELLLIGIVALIVVGPKDLPGLFHTLGRFTAKARQLGREFNRAMNEAARESGVGDVAKDLKGITSPKKFGLDRLNEAADQFEKWEPGRPAAPAKAPDSAADPERAADLAKIREATETAGRAKLDRAAAEKAANEAAETAPAKPPAAKAAAKKPAAKKAPAKSATAKAPVEKTTAKKSTAKKTAPAGTAPVKKPSEKSTKAKTE